MCITSNVLQPHGCALLQSIHSQLHDELYSTTNGSYLDVIFMHREAYFSFPLGHKTCSIGFSEIAKGLEQRAWRADRDGDHEAVVAFRNEAWIIANY